MEYLLNIALVNFLFRIAGLGLGIYVLVGIIREASEDYKSKGYRGIVDEVVLGILLIAVVGLATLAPNGPATLGSIADRIIGIGIAILNMVLDAIEGFL